MSKIVKILDDVQKGEAVQTKCLQTLHKLYRKDADHFKDELIPLLQRLLVIKQKGEISSVERLLAFISKFATKYSNDNDEFIDFLLDYLLNVTSVPDQTIRYASIQLLAPFRAIIFLFIPFSFAFSFHII
jgi:hypothetical protein